MTPSSTNTFKQPPSTTSLNNDNNSSSAHSTPSIGSNYFPSYGHGLIKISNTDDLDSMESFPLSTNNMKTIQSSYESASSIVSTTTSMVASKHDLENRNDVLEYPEIKDIPKVGVSRSKFFFDKIIESYHSTSVKGGVFLTEDIFLNYNIFKLNETIQNGSVKINIIQEINELLKKFLVVDQRPNLSTIKNSLPYYKKLMDAFDVLKHEQEIPRDNDDQISNYSSFNYSPQKSYTNDSSSIHSNTTSPASTNQSQSQQNTQLLPLQQQSKESSTSSDQKQQTPSPPSSSKKQTSNKNRHSIGFLKDHKKTDSFLLGKFKSKKLKAPLLSSPLKQQSSSPTVSTFGSSSVSSNGSSTIQDYKHLSKTSTRNSSLKYNHSRSLSVSTITTQNSTRSAKDQASISEYLTSLEFLQITLGEISQEFSNCQDEELCNKLNLVMDFLNDYILKFVLQDISILIMKHMKKSVKEFI